MMSIANPGLVASSTAAPMSASKMGGGGGGGVQSFRGRGGAFGMLLHKVQTTQSSSLAVPLPGAGVAAGPGGTSKVAVPGAGLGMDAVDGGAKEDDTPTPAGSA